MDYKYLIHGQQRLNGTIQINGSKNSSLAIIVAALLAKDKVILSNVPNISDVNYLIEILKKLNCKVKYNHHTLTIDSRNLQYQPLIMDEMKELRASYYFMGVFLSLFSKVEIRSPGGCKIGKRPINIHLDGFTAFSCQIKQEDDLLFISTNHLSGDFFELSFPSVGATVNCILASVLKDGTTTLKNVAKEPEIADLIDFLNKMGANIRGKDTNVLIIQGVQHLHGCKHRIIPDRIEGGTYILYACALANKMTIKNIQVQHQKALLKSLIDANVTMNIYKNKITIFRNEDLEGMHLNTGPYPEFPTDLQQIMCTFFTLCKGISTIHEKIFDNRYTHVAELNKLGANIQIVDNHLLIQQRKLSGNVLTCHDLRGGAALLLACMLAKGDSILHHTHYIDRGYQDLIENLNRLGAKIIKEKEYEK